MGTGKYTISLIKAAMMSINPKRLLSFESIRVLPFLMPVLIALFSFIPARTADLSPSDENKERTLTLLFVGDIMQHMPQVESAWDDSLRVYDYKPCFEPIKDLLSSADITIANFETTLGGKPYSGYPAFSSPDEIVNALIYAGIDVVGTANNHSCDRGYTGVTRTLQVFDSLNLKHTGTYASQNDHTGNNPLILRQNGFKIALLNYTYGTNGIPVPQGTIVNLLDEKTIESDVKASRDSLVDEIIAYVHWGAEYERYPNSDQKKWRDFFNKLGVRIVVGSHPHVIQPMEWEKANGDQIERLTVWSLGNFVSNQRKQYTDGGAAAILTLKKRGNNVEIADAKYALTWVYTPFINGKKNYRILPVKRFENDSTFFDSASLKAFRSFISDSRQLFKKNIGIVEAD